MGRDVNRRDEEFREFVAGRSGALLRTAYLMTGDRGLAEDLVQSALAKAYVAWGRVQSADSPDAYVHRILINSGLRARGRHRVTEVFSAHPPEVPAPDITARVDERQRLAAVVTGLPPRQRAVVVLRYFDDLSEVSVAEILGCSVGTVKSQASKALAKLRLALAEIPEEVRRDGC
jgi:RNA polymerase sigma-70 factor (sigma-E family)